MAADAGLTPVWFDAHLDLAYLAVNGRDMLRERAVDVDRPHPPCSITLPEFARGGVRMALATIFTEPGGEGPEGYPAGDAEAAHKRGRAQLEVYLTWNERDLAAIDLRSVIRADPGVGEIRGGMGVSEVVPEPIPRRLARVDGRNGPGRLHIGILMENADPIRSPEELEWWRDRGVIAVGLAWAKSSRYAGGNSTREGLTEAGRALVREMDRLGIVHDVSHLSDRALEELLAATDGRVVASHSNSRSLLGDDANQRHLRDDTIQEIARRGGVIGLNLFDRFIRAGLKDGERCTVEDAIAHVEHVCELTGSRGHVGLGSDMDGGFSAARLPRGIDSPGGLVRLIDCLRGRGWSDAEIEGFTHANWVRALQ